MIDVKRVFWAVVSHPLFLLIVGFVITMVSYGLGQFATVLGDPKHEFDHVSLLISIPVALGFCVIFGCSPAL